MDQIFGLIWVDVAMLIFYFCYLVSPQLIRNKNAKLPPFYNYLTQMIYIIWTNWLLNINSGLAGN